jgi:hypothetical protein
MVGQLHGLQRIMAVSPAWQRMIQCGTSSVNDGAGGDDGVSSCRFVAFVDVASWRPIMVLVVLLGPC